MNVPDPILWVIPAALILLSIALFIADLRRVGR